MLPGTITETYTLGDRGAVIQRAKELLNATACKISPTGVDSAGNETDVFTQFTVYAIRCYQAQNNLPVTGNLDPATWENLVAGQQPQQQTQTLFYELTEVFEPGSPEEITETYTLGDRNAVIQRAKEFLNATACKIALTGVDSAGNETNELTQFTMHALRCYQRRNDLPITGNLDPATWENLTEGGQSGQQTQQQTQTLPPIESEPETITETYALGDRNAVIQRAKELLNTTSCRIAVTGVDSAGNETDELTRFTVFALRCYQQENNLPITGTLTPATWDALLDE